MAAKKKKKRSAPSFPIRQRSQAERQALRDFDKRTRMMHSSGYRVGGRIIPPNKTRD